MRLATTTLVLAISALASGCGAARSQSAGAGVTSITPTDSARMHADSIARVAAERARADSIALAELERARADSIAAEVARARADSIAQLVAAEAMAAQARADSIAAALAAARADSVAAAEAAAERAAAAARAGEAVPEWPVDGPVALPGSILPQKRIVAYYGNPLSKRMGILGEIPPEQMLDRLDAEVAAWTAADPDTPVQPALHLIAEVAQAAPGRDGKYRLRMDSSLIEKVYGWAQSRGAILFLDIQLGQSTLQEELPYFEKFLVRPDVHLGVDPEFSMHYGSEGIAPGKRIGTLDAADVNYASDFLAKLVTEHNLPPKVLVIHRFTRGMLRNGDDIALDPRVQIVVEMDGWGAPALKRSSYRQFIYKHPVQFTGFKLFYKNDTKKGHPLMTPAQVLALFPQPLYIQYQ